MRMVRRRRALGVLFGLAFVVPACGGGGGAKSPGTGGQGGVTIDGGAGSDGAIGQDADHTVTTWPDFPPGMCAPTRPAVLDSPGVVDPEDLCKRRFQPDEVPIALGEWGYGSMGIIVSSDLDAAWPDSDYFVLSSGVADGQVVRVTIETVSGDFVPYGHFHFNGGLGSGAMDALPGEPGKARRELMWSGGSLELYVADKRATTEGDTHGAGAVYRVRFDLVEKTPVDLGALPALRTGDFTAESVVSVYSFTVPAQRGRLLLNAAAGTRLTGLPPSPLSMATMLFDPASKTSVKLESPSSQQDVKVSYDVNPQMPATTLAPGLYWLFVDTQSSSRERGAHGLRPVGRFSRRARQRQVRGRDRRDADRRNGAHDDGRHDLRVRRYGAVRHQRLVGLLSGGAQLPSARGRRRLLQRRRAAPKAPQRHR